MPSQPALFSAASVRLALAGLLVGLALATVAIAYAGVRDAGVLLHQAGPALLIVVPWTVLPIALGAASWGLLFAPQPAPRPATLAVASWIGLGVNWLLPVAQVGGELVKARWVAKRGTQGDIAAASVVVDLTLQVLTQIVFALFGVVALAILVGLGGLALPVAAAGAVLGGLIFLFYRAQKQGLFAIFARMAKRLAPAFHQDHWHGTAERIDGQVRGLYGRRCRLVAAGLVRLAFRVALAGEVWLAMYVLGEPITVMEALVVESLVQIARGAAFMIPGALGAQEGALVALGVALGFGADAALALAATKRLRELAVGLPALLVWQVAEGRAFGRLFFRKR